MAMPNDAERRINFLAEALEQANTTLRGKMDELSLVRRVGDAISHHTSVWNLSADLVNAIADAVNCKYALIYAATDAGPCELQAVSSVFSGSEQFPPNLHHTRLVRYLEQNGTPLQVDNVSQNAIWAEDWPFAPTLVSWLCVPLQARNQLRGILLLADDRAAAFDERTLRTLMVIVPQITSAFSNIDLYSHLRQSELKYRTLVERIQDVVYICDRRWQILDANPAAEALFGGSIIGRSLTEFFASPNMASEFVEAVRVSNTVQNHEAELLTDANKKIVTLMSCVTDGDYYSGIIKDLTERTHLMGQVIRAQKMESIGTLASGVAHDFNNILGIILPNAELIKMRSVPEAPATRLADIIIKATKRAAGLTRQLLSLSRKDAINLRTVSLNEAVRTTGKLLGETLDRRIRLEFALTSESTNIKADETQIEQVLLNLAINARDAMPDGGVLKFTTETDSENAIVRVTDTGIGMDDSILQNIFDPFFTTKDKSKGTGLGLSVVYGIVKQSRGSIDVKSEVGAGTEFIIRIPLTMDARRSAIQNDAKPAGGTETILIVDDEPEMLNLLEILLKDLGYSVRSARNGREAIELAGDDIDLIILDMIMPEMDGMTALRGIRQKTPDVKVLVASGYTAPDRLPVLERLGIEGFVPKPFELRKIATTVRDVLDGVVA